MFIEDNYSITRSFITKEVKITIREAQDKELLGKITLVLQPVKELFLNDDWNIAYHLITDERYKKMFAIKTDAQLSMLETLLFIICDLGQYSKFQQCANILRKELPIILPGAEIDFHQHSLKVEDLTITEEIWDRVIYLLKLSNGEKVTPPLTFTSEQARKFYLAQKAAEEKINRIKAKKNGDIDALSKMMLSITYKFPAFTFDYLWEQTMAQIQWLQKYAAGAVSYEVNAKAFAAGNVKKGKKLDFFIK